MKNTELMAAVGNVVVNASALEYAVAILVAPPRGIGTRTVRTGPLRS
jgi:hypothetical protein